MGSLQFFYSTGQSFFPLLWKGGLIWWMASFKATLTSRRYRSQRDIIFILQSFCSSYSSILKKVSKADFLGNCKSYFISLQATSPASQVTANFQAMSGTTENRPTDKSGEQTWWCDKMWWRMSLCSILASLPVYFVFLCFVNGRENYSDFWIYLYWVAHYGTFFATGRDKFIFYWDFIWLSCTVLIAAIVWGVSIMGQLSIFNKSKQR